MSFNIATSERDFSSFLYLCHYWTWTCMTSSTFLQGLNPHMWLCQHAMPCCPHNKGMTWHRARLPRRHLHRSCVLYGSTRPTKGACEYSYLHGCLKLLSIRRKCNPGSYLWKKSMKMLEGGTKERGGTNRSDKGLNLSGSWQQGHSATYNTPSRI